MQRDLNIVQVIGTITTTIEVRQNAKGRTFGQFQVASTRTVIYGQEKRQETETFSIVVCDGLAQLCQPEIQPWLSTASAIEERSPHYCKCSQNCC